MNISKFVEWVFSLWWGRKKAVQCIVEKNNYLTLCHTTRWWKQIEAYSLSPIFQSGYETNFSCVQRTQVPRICDPSCSARYKLKKTWMNTELKLEKHSDLSSKIDNNIGRVKETVILTGPAFAFLEPCVPVQWNTKIALY